MNSDSPLQEWYNNIGHDEKILDIPRCDFKPQKPIITDMNNSRQLADSATSIAELKLMVENFEGCGLKKLATKTVFADGIADSGIVLVGEAPGANEDIQGIPFCGDSGKLLDNVIASINLSRKTNCYITNTIFWRPPGNRRPTDEEIKICRPFVEKHISLLNPKLLILVGSVAACSFLNSNASMSELRTKIMRYKNQYMTHHVDTITIFHPSYLLRQPSQKKQAWFDMLSIDQHLKSLRSV
jgi:uracil-DNA glycosylase